jgi:hypothetical protein
MLPDYRYTPSEHEYATGGPDPRDRFPWFFAAILAAAVICAAFGWVAA